MTTAKSKAISALRERALALLARREHTALELKRKLMRKPQQPGSRRFPRQDAEDFSADADVVAQADVPEQPAIPDDELEEHVDQLLQDFKQRGWLSEQRFTEQVVHARQQIYRKKFAQPPASREEWAKQARFMQSRGFSMDMIKRVINAGNQVETTDSEDR
jgi:regulatory protein